MSETRLRYDHCAVVWVKLGTPDRKQGHINPTAATAVGDFQRFLMKEEIYSARTMVSGGGHFEGLFWVDEWPKVEAWLKENGWSYGSTQPDQDWGEYEQMGG